MLDGFAQGAEFATIVRGFMEKATESLREEIAQLRAQVDMLKALPDLAEVEAAVARHLEANPPAAGEPGKDAEPVSETMLADLVARHLEANPPAAGEPGKDAEPVSETMLAGLVARHLEANPPAPGEPGKDAEPVSETLLAELVARHLEANPPAAGEPGKDAEPISEALLADLVARHLEANPPAPGAPGEPGKAGPDLSGAFKDETGELILTLGDGTVLRTGLRDGLKGADGKDGLDPDAIKMTWGEDGRTPTFVFIRDDVGVVVEVDGETGKFLVDREVYQDGRSYAPGDGVTFGGSYWIARHETTEKPGASADWRLAVKKGRDANPRVKVDPPRKPPQVRLDGRST